VSDISANVARDLAHDLVVAEERITAMESQELGFVATLSQMEAEIAALREQVTDLQETKDVLYADNVRLIEQVARMPPARDVFEAIKHGDDDHQEWLRHKLEEILTTYIDPPADSGEG
jgi:hypothetical protein